jgi:hypothetical protein
MNAKTAVAIVTCYLIGFVVMLNFNLPETTIIYMFFLSPFLLIWMVYEILADDKHKYPELGKNEEWGYRDKKRDELGVF